MNWYIYLWSLPPKIHKSASIQQCSYYLWVYSCLEWSVIYVYLCSIHVAVSYIGSFDSCLKCFVDLLCILMHMQMFGSFLSNNHITDPLILCFVHTLAIPSNNVNFCQSIYVLSLPSIAAMYIDHSSCILISPWPLELLFCYCHDCFQPYVDFCQAIYVWRLCSIITMYIDQFSCILIFPCPSLSFCFAIVMIASSNMLTFVKPCMF